MDKKLLFAILTIVFWISLILIFYVFMPNVSFSLILVVVIVILNAISISIATQIIINKIFNF